MLFLSGESALFDAIGQPLRVPLESEIPLLYGEDLEAHWFDPNKVNHSQLPDYIEYGPNHYIKVISSSSGRIVFECWLAFWIATAEVYPLLEGYFPQLLWALPAQWGDSTSELNY